MKSGEGISLSSHRNSRPSGGCGCSKDSGSTPGLDFESIGRARFLSELQQSARLTLSSLPEADATEKLIAPAREFFEHYSEMLISASSTSKWGDDEIRAFAQEMSWVKIVMDFQVSVLAKQKNDDTGGDSDPDCSKAYDSCMNASGCVNDSWFCLCCIPCSLKYTRCILGLPFGGSGGIFAA